jgi:hypothetical protein
MLPRVLAGWVLSSLVAGCAYGPPTAARVGPLGVAVTEEGTGRPIKGVQIDVAWEAIRMRGGLSGRIESVIGYKIVHRASAVTDAGGRVRLPAEEVRLAGNERISRLHVFVNLEVDPSASHVLDVLEHMRKDCREDRESCAGEPSKADLARFFLAPDERSSSAYRNPDPGHRGLALMVDEMTAGQDWSQLEDRFRIQWVVSRLGGELTLDAHLERCAGEP